MGTVSCTQARWLSGSRQGGPVHRWYGVFEGLSAPINLSRMAQPWEQPTATPQLAASGSAPFLPLGNTKPGPLYFAELFSDRLMDPDISKQLTCFV